MSDLAPRWLSSTEQQVWRTYLRGVAALDERMEDDLQPFGIDLAEYEILVQLAEAPDQRLRMSQLAQEVHQSRSRLTHTISRMEKAGHVERAACADDRRGVLAILTEQGRQLLVEAAPHHVESVRSALLDRISPEDWLALGRVFASVLADEDEPDSQPASDPDAPAR